MQQCIRTDYGTDFMRFYDQPEYLSCTCIILLTCIEVTISNCNIVYYWFGEKSLDLL